MYVYVVCMLLRVFFSVITVLLQCWLYHGWSLSEIVNPRLRPDAFLSETRRQQHYSVGGETITILKVKQGEVVGAKLVCAVRQDDAKQKNPSPASFQSRIAPEEFAVGVQAAECVSYWQPQYSAVDTQQDEAPSIFSGVHAGAQEGLDALFYLLIPGEGWFA